MSRHAGSPDLTRGCFSGLPVLHFLVSFSRQEGCHGESVHAIETRNGAIHSTYSDEKSSVEPWKNPVLASAIRARSMSPPPRNGRSKCERHLLPSNAKITIPRRVHTQFRFSAGRFIS
jgi:hypothetical protein